MIFLPIGDSNIASQIDHSVFPLALRVIQEALIITSFFYLHCRLQLQIPNLQAIQQGTNWNGSDF